MDSVYSVLSTVIPMYMYKWQIIYWMNPTKGLISTKLSLSYVSTNLKGHMHGILV